MADPTTDAPVADAGVAELQQALKLYAQTTGYAPADPGEVDGIVGVKTATATLNVIPRLPGLPAEVAAIAKLGAAALPAFGLEYVAKIITAYAGYISKAILALNVYDVIDAAEDGSGSGGGGGHRRPASVLAPWASAAGGAIYAPSVIRTPSGDLIPGDPTKAIWFRDWWTGMYRVAAPRPAGLGANSYRNYVETVPSMSRPATGAEVSRSTFMMAVGKWYKTTPALIAIAAGVTGAGVGTYLLVRR